MPVEIAPQERGHFKRLKVSWNGRLAFALNPGSLERDFLLQRPTVHPLNTPEGYTVTEHGAHNRVHHKGVWIGHSKVNGVNCFHDGPDCGRIVVRERRLEADAEGARLEFALEWLDPAGAPVLAEERLYLFRPAVAGTHPTLRAHRLDVRSTLIASLGPVEFKQENHAYMGVRVADILDEDDGGRVVNSRGQAGEAEAMGQVADWIDASGAAGSHRFGVTLMVHPASPPTPFFVRSYGTMLSDLFLQEGCTLAAGERLTQGFAVLAHDGDGESFGVGRAYADFAASDLLA